MKKLLLFLLILACIPLCACKTPTDTSTDTPKDTTDDPGCRYGLIFGHASYEEFYNALHPDPSSRLPEIYYHDPYYYTDPEAGKFYDSFVAALDSLDVLHKPLFNGQPMELFPQSWGGITVRMEGYSYYIPEIIYQSTDESPKICIIYLATLENDVVLTKNDVIDVLPYIYFHERIGADRSGLYLQKLKQLLNADRITLQLADRTVIAYEYIITPSETKSTQFYTFLYDGMIVEVSAKAGQINAEYFINFSLG